MKHAEGPARREFIKFLAASPYVAALGGVAAFLQQRGLAQDVRQSGFAQITRDRMSAVENPADALTVFDFEETARRKVMPGHWSYMASGIDDDATLLANREGFRQVQLRPRRLRDATKVDMHVEWFGTTYTAPSSPARRAVSGRFTTTASWPSRARPGRAARCRCCRPSTSIGVEEVNKALGRPVWQQLYAPSSWDACAQLLKRIEASGVTVIALTVDNTTGRFSETYLRTRPKDMKQCEQCHEGGPDVGRHRPMLDGINMKGVRFTDPAMDWTFVDRLRGFWKGKFFIKGIDTREDARLALEHGLDGILVSNHGGRSTETGRSTIEALPEVVGRGRRPDSRCFSTAACVAAPTCSRRWRWARRASASAVPCCGDWAPSARRASTVCSRSCRPS